MPEECHILAYAASHKDGERLGAQMEKKTDTHDFCSQPNPIAQLHDQM
jgi:hypothetical protein